MQQEISVHCQVAAGSWASSQVEAGNWDSSSYSSGLTSPLELQWEFSVLSSTAMELGVPLGCLGMLTLELARELRDPQGVAGIQVSSRALQCWTQGYTRAMVGDAVCLLNCSVASSSRVV